LLAALFRSGVPSPPPHDRVAATVLLADPDHNPADPRTAGGTFEPRYAAPRAAPPSPRRSMAASGATAADMTSSASATTWPPARTPLSIANSAARRHWPFGAVGPRTHTTDALTCAFSFSGMG
jgi:hypothetical protein